MDCYVLSFVADKPENRRNASVLAMEAWGLKEQFEESFSSLDDAFASLEKYKLKSRPCGKFELSSEELLWRVDRFGPVAEAQLPG